MTPSTPHEPLRGQGAVTRRVLLVRVHEAAAALGKRAFTDRKPLFHTAGRAPSTKFVYLQQPGEFFSVSFMIDPPWT